MLDLCRHVVAAGRRLPFGFESFEQLVVQREHAAGVERALQRLRVALAGDVLEQLVDAVAPLEHRVVFLARPDQVRQRELLLGQVKLKRVAERDLERVVLPPRAALEEELALLADDEQFRGFAGPAREVDDGVDHPDVEVRHHDRQLFGRKRLADAGLARRPRTGDGRGLDGRRHGLHARKAYGKSGGGKRRKPAVPLMSARFPRRLELRLGPL